MKRIGIFSGTFDPIHNGHLAFAQAAIKSHNLSKVIFIIEQSPRRKNNVTPYEMRTEMLRRAIAARADFDIVEAPEQQLTLAGTLPYLRVLFKDADIYLLVGEDVAKDIKNWPGAKKLLRGLAVIVAQRGAEGLTGVSSSKIRSSITKDQPNLAVPPTVAHYIKAHKLYESASSE